jgi:hypothetical protein
MSYDTCTHDESDKDMMLADGLCPLCMQAEIDRLREALAWYADESHYLRGAPGKTFACAYQPVSWILDNGQRARDALKGGKS